MAACCAADKGRSSVLNFLRFRLSRSTERLLIPGWTSSMASSVAIANLLEARTLFGKESRVKHDKR